jgi:hypothetical protein
LAIQRPAKPAAADDPSIGDGNAQSHSELEDQQNALTESLEDHHPDVRYLRGKLVEAHGRLHALEHELQIVLRDRQQRMRQQLRNAMQQAATSTGTDDVQTIQTSNGGTRTSRVLARAGDSVTVSRAGIAVNGVGLAGLPAEFIAGLPEATWQQTVPDKHVFVIVEESAGTRVSRYWGLVPVVLLSRPVTQAPKLQP